MSSLKVVRLAIVAWTLIWQNASFAQKPSNITPGEWALIPEYCVDVQGFKYGDEHYNPSPRAAYWVSLMGRTFWAQHHYCWGLINIRRAQTLGFPKEKFSGAIKAAIADFHFVLNNERPGYVLAPEVWLKIGDAHLLLEDHGSAMLAYTESLKRKPDYWPAYTHWAEALARVGRQKEALAHLEKALRLMPDERQLHAAYRKLGGNTEAFLRTLPPRKPANSASSASSAPVGDAAATNQPASAPGPAASAQGS